MESQWLPQLPVPLLHLRNLRSSTPLAKSLHPALPRQHYSLQPFQSDAAQRIQPIGDDSLSRNPMLPTPQSFPRVQVQDSCEVARPTAARIDPPPLLSVRTRPRKPRRLPPNSA